MHGTSALKQLGELDQGLVQLGDGSEPRVECHSSRVGVKGLVRMEVELSREQDKFNIQNVETYMTWGTYILK